MILQVFLRAQFEDRGIEELSVRIQGIFIPNKSLDKTFCLCKKDWAELIGVTEKLTICLQMEYIGK